MTNIEQIAHLGNREYRVERFETVDTRVLRWQVVSQPINARTGKGWQATKRHSSFLKTPGEAFEVFNKLVGWADDLELGEWEPHPEDPDASKADAVLIRNRR